LRADDMSRTLEALKVGGPPLQGGAASGDTA
jgi:hypothetical protein